MDEIVQIASHAEDRHDNTALLRFETDAEHSGCVTTIIWTTGMMQFSSKKNDWSRSPRIVEGDLVPEYEKNRASRKRKFSTGNHSLGMAFFQIAGFV